MNRGNWAILVGEIRTLVPYPSRWAALAALRECQTRGIRGLLARVPWELERPIPFDGSDPAVTYCYGSGAPLPGHRLASALSGRCPIMY